MKREIENDLVVETMLNMESHYVEWEVGDVVYGFIYHTFPNAPKT